jgi:hypothetical protein
MLATARRFLYKGMRTGRSMEFVKKLTGVGDTGRVEDVRLD